MTTLAMTFSRNIGRPRAAYRTCSRPAYLKRWRYLIEHSDWDGKVRIYEEKVNNICIGIIIAAVLYFVPILVKVFLR